MKKKRKSLMTSMAHELFAELWVELDKLTDVVKGISDTVIDMHKDIEGLKGKLDFMHRVDKEFQKEVGKMTCNKKPCNHSK